jgi:hypothetical protein
MHFSKRPIWLFGETATEFAGDATYEEVQLKIAGPANRARAAQLLFYSEKNVLLSPRRNPTALDLYSRHPLKPRWLTDEATACSVDLFSPLTIDLYDNARTKTTKAFLWLRKGSTVTEMTATIPDWFGVKRDKSTVYVVSPKRHADLVQKILSDDQPVNNTKRSVDTLPCRLLATCGDIAVPLQESLPVSGNEQKHCSVLSLFKDR